MPTIALAPCGRLPDYEAALRDAGADPWVLDRERDRPADVVASARGLLLAGGGDVQPTIYGETAHPAFSGAEPGRDEYEIELVRRALDADLPVLAICRGIQVLNVARGGTLIQHIPDEVGGTINHYIQEPRFAIAHAIRVTSNSLLAGLLRTRLENGHDCPVNSRHHQAPHALGEGLVATATAPDGVIEAIEDPRHRFCLGVQWHPENFYRTGEFKPLFDGFVKVCA
jgi:putative glutamine amidotransferase